MKLNGTLTLIPTPLSEVGELEPVAFALLQNAALNDQVNSIFVIEDLKPSRRRWLNFKLPRESVESFVLYNEHTASVVSKELLSELQSGKNVFLMSDGGLPAFYDPGVELVKMCHQNHIRVTSTPFCNSVVLAMALSGFNHKKFWFEGFLPLENAERIIVIKKLLAQKYPSILMDTPYRLKRVLEEFVESWGNNPNSKKLFLALDLNSPTEELRLGTPKELLGAIADFKREFILIISE
ncbi:MAG: SAM-dependent methyltransferase [Bacteriovorax sp.]|nr:SAM-dependent methyltransferase [Bacteriovorax sp.]